MEHFVGEFIRNGWICAQAEEDVAYLIVDVLHEEGDDCRGMALLIACQLLALGVFRRPESDANAKPQFPRSYFVLSMNMMRQIMEQKKQKRMNGTRTKEKQTRKSTPVPECRRLRPLLLEYFHKPLSLLQLSRVQIRRSIGLMDFERRVKTLHLPPLLLTYEWRANEMLADVNEVSLK